MINRGSGINKCGGGGGLLLRRIGRFSESEERNIVLSIFIPRRSFHNPVKSFTNYHKQTFGRNLPSSVNVMCQPANRRPCSLKGSRLLFNSAQFAFFWAVS